MISHVDFDVTSILKKNLSLIMTYSLIALLLPFSVVVGQTQTTSLLNSSSTAPIQEGSDENNLLTRINGRLLFVVGNTSNITVDSEEIKGLLRSALGITQDVFVLSPVIEGSKIISMEYTVQLYRPPAWTSYNDANVWLNQIRAEFSIPSAVFAIFGSTKDNNSFTEAFMDVNECASSWSVCHSNADCHNTIPGYECDCVSGYTGNGFTCSAITCTLSSAPAAPPMGKRTFAFENGTTLSNPPFLLPYGATITYECERYFKFTDTSADGNAGVVIAFCQDTGWQNVDVGCVMKLEFRIAVAIAAGSSLIIILVVGCFAANRCVDAERKAREKKGRREEDGWSFENNIFDNS